MFAIIYDSVNLPLCVNLPQVKNHCHRGVSQWERNEDILTSGFEVNG